MFNIKLFYFILRWVYVGWKIDIALVQVSSEPAPLSHKVESIPHIINKKQVDNMKHGTLGHAMAP